MAATKKFSEITVSAANIKGGDFLVGVQGGTTDVLFSSMQVARIILTGNVTYFVRATGSDSNPGTITSPWLTLQHAIDYIATNLDTAGFIITISIGAGSFAGCGLKPIAGGGIIFLNGSGVASTTITLGPNDGVYNLGECISAYVPLNGNVFFDNLTIDGTGGSFGNDGVIFAQAGNILFAANALAPSTGNIKYIGTATSFVVALQSAFFNDAQNTGASATVTTAAGALHGFITADANSASLMGNTYTISGNPTCSIGFLSSTNNGAIEFFGAFSGALTGASYQTLAGGNITVKPGVTVPGTTGGTIDATSGYNGNISTVAKLPNAVGSEGGRWFVTDSTVGLAAGLGNIVAGVGGNAVPVYSDNVNWRIG